MQILVACPGPPDVLAKFMQETGAAAAGFRAMCDHSGGFTRMLGLDLSSEGPPWSQRYAGLVTDGILVKLVRAGSNAPSAWLPFSATRPLRPSAARLDGLLKLGPARR